MAAITERIELTTAILILPQRETVLVAKQLAEIDVLSNGRLRAGMGIGWNAIEFESLGKEFRSRARRLEEQMTLLRRLWTEPEVEFDGRFDRVPGAGINPLPVQRPIPLWIGAFAAPAIARAGRLSDGLLLNPRVKPGPEAERDITIFRAGAREQGRDPMSLGLDVTLFTEGRDASSLRAEYQAWCAHQPTHVTVRTMSAGYTRVSEHLRALEDARRAIT
jgi:probable F420-dependent oxidoreductase